jgi:hypothetical protein
LTCGNPTKFRVSEGELIMWRDSASEKNIEGRAKQELEMTSQNGFS